MCKVYLISIDLFRVRVRVRVTRGTLFEFFCYGLVTLIKVVENDPRKLLLKFGVGYPRSLRRNHRKRLKNHDFLTIFDVFVVFRWLNGKTLN